MTQSKAQTTSLSSEKLDKNIRKISWVLALGVLLNPLNSSMIAVALLQIGDNFQVNVATATWLLSGFYLAGTIGPSLAGKLTDVFGSKKLFTIGILLVTISSILAVWAPNFGTLLMLRIIQGLGSSIAFPTGMTILRSVTAQYEPNQTSNRISSSLGLMSITANVMAAFGPTLGGVLIKYVSWHAIFWINIPIAIIILILVRLWIPADRVKRPEHSGSGRPKQSIWKGIDIVGIILFIIMLTTMMLFLLSLSDGTYWWLLMISVISAISFFKWEKRISSPFLDIKMLSSNPRLLSVFLQFAGVNIVYYSLFFSLPIWLDQVKGFDSKTTGLLMLPFAGLGVLMTPVAVRINNRYGYRTTIIAGNLVLIFATLFLLILGENSSLPVILMVTAILGIPNGLNNMGLQAALYHTAKPEETGIASGLFQTFRSIGSILSTSLLGLIFGGTVTSSGLHTLALITAGLSMVLFIVISSRKLA